MYFMRVYFAGDYVLVKKHTPRGRFPLKKRLKRMKETPEAVKRYNNKRRAEKIQLLILCNFDKGYHITLDYPKGEKPETYEQAEKNLTDFLHKTSRRLKKKGKQFKYIAVTERGKKAAALHHHMVIENDSDVLAEVLAVWGQYMHISTMYEEGQYKELAEYLVKVETKEELTKGRSKYHRSRNLIKPLEKSALIDRPLTDDPRIPKGYTLIESSLVNGFNEFIGVKHQKFMLKKIPDPEIPKMSENVRDCPRRPEVYKKGNIFTRLKRKLFGRKT